VGESQLQQTCLGRNGDTNLIGEVEAAAPLPVFLIQEDLHHRAQLGTLGVIKHAVVGHVRVHEDLPLGRERAFSRLGTTMIAEPVKHGQHPPSGKSTL